MIHLPKGTNINYQKLNNIIYNKRILKKIKLNYFETLYNLFYKIYIIVRMQKIIVKNNSSLNNNALDS